MASTLAACSASASVRARSRAVILAMFAGSDSSRIMYAAVMSSMAAASADRQAEDLFKAASGGATLHQLRHSALTHDAEAGASTPMLLAKSGHTSVASLARYARPPAEALARWQERNDPARRR